MSRHDTRKPMSVLLAEAEDQGQGTLVRRLGAVSLVALGIGAIIGAGLFSLTGVVAGQHAGPAVVLSFVISAVGCAFAGLCYAEFASIIPIAGSAYTYSFATMGRIWAWVIGWDLVLEYAVGAAMVAISWSQYLNKLLAMHGMHIPEHLMAGPFEGGWFNLPAVIIVALMSLLLARGTRESAGVNAIIVVLKVAVVLVFIFFGWSYINPANLTPFIPPNNGVWGEFGWSGVLRGAGIIFFAYIGFDAVSTAAQETKNPKRNMPIGILGSLAICAVLYVLFGHVMTGLANYTEFGSGTDSLAPVATAIKHTPYVWLQQAVIIAILAGYSSVILVMLMGQSRVFYSMSHDGLLPKVFSDVHPKYRTPFKSNMFFMLFVGAFAAFVPGRVVGEMTSIGTLLAFILVSIGVLIIRKRMPDAPRGFRTPLVPLVPILGVVVCGAMMLALPWDTWLRLVVWLGIGMVVYFRYSAKHSKF
ncbi:MAG: amino acid permease [Flavobacteriales bacterium]|nr:amino acid permease [Flavobacteriales bacterium]MBK7248999.1 amino acid permease [Flavobacteriales bacterium]MBK9599965.1 amino acid permease [Flavobacteriales bacterium]QQS71247.1 MAG: amino acid permease [Flavobacteriales bacterium]HQV39443.1 amino acid permease [Flavobacteriales bacterium]